MCLTCFFSVRPSPSAMWFVGLLLPRNAPNLQPCGLDFAGLFGARRVSAVVEVGMVSHRPALPSLRAHPPAFLRTLPAPPFSLLRSRPGGQPTMHPTASVSRPVVPHVPHRGSLARPPASGSRAAPRPRSYRDTRYPVPCQEPDSRVIPAPIFRRPLSQRPRIVVPSH